MIDSRTRMFCLIGNPVGHSVSPAMHNAAFAKLGLNCAYFASQVEENDLEFSIEALRALGLGGANVTIPYKEKVLGLLDEVDGTAEKIGAVNTIVNKAGALKGFNTDAPGAFDAFEQAGVRLKDEAVLLLGAGGAARAVGFALASWGGISSLSILSQDEKDARALAEHIHRETGASVHGDEMNEKRLAHEMEYCGIVANCTPVGMKSNDSLVPKELMRKEQAFFDAVYNPLRTRMLKNAAAAGCKIIGGEKMLVLQGAKAFELWTGKKAPVAAMERAALAALGKRGGKQARGK